MEDLAPNKIVKKQVASCFLINLNFLLPQTTQLDESIILPFFIFSVFDFLLSVFFFFFFLHFKQ